MKLKLNIVWQMTENPMLNYLYSCDAQVTEQYGVTDLILKSSFIQDIKFSSFKIPVLKLHWIQIALCR